MRDLTSTANGLRDFLTCHREWIYDDGENTFYLLSNEIRLGALAGSFRIAFLCGKGLDSFEFREFKITDERLIIEIGDANRPAKRVEFVPRVKAQEFRENTEQIRLGAVNGIADGFSNQLRKFRPLRVALNEQNGRFAEITARFGSRYVAVLSDVSGAVQHESILSKALIWLRSLNSQRRHQIKEVWIVAEQEQSATLGTLIGCLKSSDSKRLAVWKSRPIGSNAAGSRQFERKLARKFNSLWAGSLPRLDLQEKKPLSRFAARLRRTNPEGVDIVNTAQGETIRFHGLTFARTRTIGGEEKVWFGTEREKTILDDSSSAEFAGLIEALSQYRRFDAPNKQHEFYRASPEAWLESLLRRNIRQLDSNLVLSPIYNQFRAAREKIDLLALRQDGRLVIIELKIAPDRDMLFQAVDYWRRVESQRRRGKLDELSLFGEKKISKRPTVIYLVAPTLGFHHDLQYFANLVREEIKIYRFDLAENWRKEVKVLMRRKLGSVTSDSI